MMSVVLFRCRSKLLQSYDCFHLVYRSSCNRSSSTVIGSQTGSSRNYYSSLQAAAASNNSTSNTILRSSSLVLNYSTTMQNRTFSSALSKEEEEWEKLRVSRLSPEEKKMELRELDYNIKRLNTLRGINTGELYTWRGQMKALTRDYGIGFLAWYYTVWGGMFSLIFVGIEYGGVDALEIISQLDHYTGYDLASKINPTLGSAAVSAVINECLEPLRLVFVVSTTKPVVNMFTERT